MSSKPLSRRPFRDLPYAQDAEGLARLAADLADRAVDDPRLVSRAEAVRSEAEVVGRVASFSRPEIDGDAGPAGPGRGEIEAGNVGRMVYCPRRDGLVPATIRAVRRRAPRTLRDLPGHLQDAAERYVALVEAVGAVRGVDWQASGSAGVSDGGAVARCGEAEARRRADQLIGAGLALSPKGRGVHRDINRRAITVLSVVQLVCVRHFSIDAVLARHGWSRRQEFRDALAEALADALARLARAGIGG